MRKIVSDRSVMNPQGKSQQVREIVILRTEEENPLTNFISITNQFLLGLNLAYQVELLNNIKRK